MLRPLPPELFLFSKEITMFKVNYKILEESIRHRLLENGVEASTAAHVSKGLIHASLRGIDSHGIRLLPHYLKGVKRGRINPVPSYKIEAVSDSAVLFDADHTFGHAAGKEAVEIGMEFARKSGIAHVAVRNSTHCGAMSYFALKAAQEGFACMAMTNATPRLTTPGGSHSFVGNNPICFTAPINNQRPFCYDGANSIFTFNKVANYRENGRVLPENVAADSSGIMTTNPSEAEQLIPIGDYKGFGLALMVDILCSIMTCSPSGPNVTKMFGSDEIMSEKRYLGHYFIIIDISRFVQLEIFMKNMKQQAELLKNSERIHQNIPPYLPGELEDNCAVKRMSEGIPIEPSMLDYVTEMLKHTGNSI